MVVWGDELIWKCFGSALVRDMQNHTRLEECGFAFPFWFLLLDLQVANKL